MKIKEFIIRNFKGIKHAKIAVSGDVVTLIGLNESGKTTILEAISNYISTDTNTRDLVNTVFKKASLQEIIPISKKAAFSDSVSIAADVDLEDEDIEKLKAVFKDKHSLSLDVKNMQRSSRIDRSYKFEDSELKSTMSYWNINFPMSGKAKGGRRIVGNNIDGDAEEKKIWIDGIKVLQERHPKIAYFPTFLFDFPERIYVSPDANNVEHGGMINTYYSQVIQDVLDSEGGNLSIKTHVIDRIERFKKQEDIPFAFLSKFSVSSEKRQVDAVMQRVSSEMTRVIFGAWNQILGRRESGKRIQIDWSTDAYKDNAVFLEVSIIDGDSRYLISERSLGFRWFFSFLLLTQFRRNRKDGGGTIFLFDEPAANLHSKAQVKLLESFTRIAGDLTKIIYSTHSHYMVNPLWLENSYIISNDAVDAESDYDVASFTARDTNIVATKYRTFVGSHPSQTTYFQPVLDALDVGFSPLVSSARALIVEGKFDYFPIVYLRMLSRLEVIPQIFPANGAGNAARIISLFRGWGVQFAVLLDADDAGKTAKEKYMNEYFLTEQEVVTLGDLDPALIGKSFESLYQDDVKDEIKERFSISHIKKQHYSLFFQELVNTASEKKFPQTVEKFRPISEWMDEQFGTNPTS